MVTKIGKIIFCIYVSLFFSLFSEQELVLKALSEDNQLLESAAVGVPFKISLTLKNTEIDKPIISGLDKLTVLHATQHYSVRWHNNNTQDQERTYIYTVQTSNPDVLQIGPVEIITPQGKIKSNVLTINVENRPPTFLSQNNQAHKNQISGKNIDSDDNQVSLEVSLSTHDSVIGEYINTKVTFKTTNPKITLEKLEIPTIDGLKFFDFKKQVTRQKTIKNTLYYVVKWQGIIEAQKSGTFFISPLRAYYTIARKGSMTNNWFGQFFGGKLTERKIAYSDSLQITVHDLPKSNKDNQAIGVFTKIGLRSSTDKVKNHEGFTVTLELEGKGNINAITPPKLELPTSMISYPSKQTVLEHKGQKVKQFEYVVQALEVGNYTIPEQTFAYFDTQTRSHKILKTEPINLTILPAEYTASHAAPHVDQTQEVQSDASAQAIPIMKNRTNLAEVVDTYTQKLKQQYKMPLWLFFALLFLPLLVIIWLSRFDFVGWFKHNFTIQKSFRWTWIIARKQVQRDEQNGTYYALYGVLKNALQQRIAYRQQKLITSTYTDEEIEGYLAHNKILSVEQLKAWHIFNSDLLSYAYNYHHVLDNKTQKYLFDQAKMWIQNFEKFL